MAGTSINRASVEVAMKTHNCKVAIVFVALVCSLFPTPSYAQQKPRKATALRLDYIVACTHSPTMPFLRRSVDEIRATSTETVGQTSYYDRRVEIHWSDAGDRADIFSFAERKFCSSGSLELVTALQGLQSVRYASAIHRDAGHSYSLSVQQVYSGNHTFLQKRSAGHFLTITIEPVQCNAQAGGEGGVVKNSTKIWKSETGVSIQWQEGKKKNDWVFYRAIYESPGCD
jgi:hypothetical protein